MYVVVTGASQGIGRAIAEAFATRPGVRLALVARRADALEAVAAACRGAGATATIHCSDVTDDEQVAALGGDILAVAPPDVLINNVGRFRPGALLETTPRAFREQVEVNLTSAFLVTRALLPAMIAAGAGRVVFLASVASIQAYPGGGAYCAAKHGLLGLARAFRMETLETGVGVTAILPGATWTPSWEGVPVPEDRFIPAQDVAAAIVALCGLSPRTVPEELLLRPRQGDL